jgi:hypothetical protein
MLKREGKELGEAAQSGQEHADQASPGTAQKQGSGLPPGSPPDSEQPVQHADGEPEPGTTITAAEDGDVDGAGGERGSVPAQQHAADEHPGVPGADPFDNSVQLASAGPSGPDSTPVATSVTPAPVHEAGTVVDAGLAEGDFNSQLGTELTADVSGDTFANVGV